MARNRKHKQKKNFAEKRREKQKVQTLIVEKNNTGYGYVYYYIERLLIVYILKITKFNY